MSKGKSQRGRPLQIVPDQRFDCRSCGRCCRSWNITFSQADHERLSKIEWGTIFPELAGKELFVPAGEENGKPIWRFALRRHDDACWFLDEESRCRMHAHLGGEKKAIVCRAFPFSIAHTEAGAFASLRFNCPTVVAGDHGRPVSEQRKDVERLDADYAKDEHAARKLAGLTIGGGKTDLVPDGEMTVAFAPGYRLEWPDIGKIEATLDGCITRDEMSLTGRLIAATHILAAPWTRARLTVLEQANQQAVADGDRVAVGIEPELIFEVVRSDDAERRALKAPPAPTLMHRVLSRHLLRHVVSRPWSMRILEAGLARRLTARAGLFVRDLMLLAGFGSISPESFGRSVGVRAIARSVSTPVPVATASAMDETLARFVRAKLFGKFFFGPRFHRFHYVAGFNFVVLCCSLARAIARGHALAHDRLVPELQDLHEGVIAVEDAFFSSAPFAGFHGRGLQLALLDVEALARTTRFWDWRVVG